MKIKTNKGFTLLEILIVLVILAVLAGLAIPAYQSAVEKARKQEALSTLAAIRSSQQRFFAGNSSYSANFTALDFDPMVSVTGNITHFSYALSGGGGGSTTYTATGTRNGLDAPGTSPANYTVRILQDGVIQQQY